MNLDYIVPFLPLISALVLGGAGGLWVILNRRGGDKTKNTVPPAPTWPEMWKQMQEVSAENAQRFAAQEARIQHLEDRTEKLHRERTALINIIGALADQWPSDHPKPNLSTYDIEVIGGDTLPHKFRRPRA